MSDLELSPREREELGRAALDWVLKYFAQQSHLPVYPAISERDLSAQLRAPLPIAAESPDDVFEEFASIVDGSRHNGHPRMYGYVQSAASFAGVIGDFLASALNQNVTSWRSAPSATTIEHQVVDWLKTMVGFDPGGSGILLSGGSFANFSAIAIALRNSASVDINRLGVAALPGKPRIYASMMTHMSITKAAAMLGVGRDAIVQIPVDDQYRMNPASLERQILADKDAGCLPVCVVATAGDVNTGAIDSLDAIADICAADRHDLWLHVDGSYGALAARSPYVDGAMGALSRVDSLSLDPHKWLFAPLDAGCLLVRAQASLREAFAVSADYIDVVADGDMSEFAYWDHSPELSRRFRALKLWFLLKSHGSRAVQDAIDRNIEAARHLADLIVRSDDFELLAPVPLSIVCFRYRHGDDEFNKRVMLEVQRGGDSYLSNTKLGDRFALRACIVNYRTTPADVEHLLDTVRSIAQSLR